jgi:hypothetical protein
MRLAIGINRNIENLPITTMERSTLRVNRTRVPLIRVPHKQMSRKVPLVPGRGKLQHKPMLTKAPHLLERVKLTRVPRKLMLRKAPQLLGKDMLDQVGTLLPVAAPMAQLIPLHIVRVKPQRGNIINESEGKA